VSFRSLGVGGESNNNEWWDGGANKDRPEQYQGGCDWFGRFYRLARASLRLPKSGGGESKNAVSGST